MPFIHRRQVYVFGDYTAHDSPKKWAEAVLTAYNRHEANLIVGEVNNGGDLVERNIKAVNSKIPFKAIHASMGKAIKAETISTLYEQGMAYHFVTFPQLEDQMSDWVLGVEKSPNKMDTLICAITKLTKVYFQRETIDLTKLIIKMPRNSMNMNFRTSKFDLPLLATMLIIYR